MIKTLKVTPNEFDAIVAALRCLAVELHYERITPDDGDIGSILTNAGEHEGLNSESVHDLCDRLLGAPTP